MEIRIFIKHSNHKFVFKEQIVFVLYTSILVSVSIKYLNKFQSTGEINKLPETSK